MFGNFFNSFVNAFVSLQMLLIKRFLWNPFLRQTRAPQTVQDELLLKIINSNQGSRFGKEHKFKSLRSYGDFRKALPVQTYEDLRPYIEEQAQDKSAALTVERPILYSRTSGTTGQPKYIPILKTTLSQLRKSQALICSAQYENIPNIFTGRILAIGSPVIEGRLGSGMPYGSMSGLVRQSMPYFLRLKYVVPEEIFAIEDYRLKYLLISAYALSERNITFMASANPTTFFKIMDTIKDNADSLLRFLATGDISHLADAANPKKNSVKYFLKANKARVKEIGKIINSGGDLTFARLWPDLAAVATWTGGNCGAAIPKIRSLLPEGARIVEMGYIASEFRGGIPMDVVSGENIPTFWENFFEFAELDDWDKNNQKFLTLGQVETGKRYYVIVTTASGLYRYFINDVIEITGKFNNTPTLAFIQKGKGVTNLTGEKLYETQVIEAVQAMGIESSSGTGFFIMLADNTQTQYTLYIEHPPLPGMESKFEERLFALNIEFEAKRKSGRLLQTYVKFLKEGCGEAYKEALILKGQREGQFKMARLLYRADCQFDFLHYERSGHEN